MLLIFAIASKNPKKRKCYLIVTLLFSSFCTNAFIEGIMMNAYQAGYPKVQKFDVGIVLGGFSGVNKRNNEIAFNWAGDRLFQTIALYKKGQIKQLLLSKWKCKFNRLTSKRS